MEKLPRDETDEKAFDLDSRLRGSDRQGSTTMKLPFLLGFRYTRAKKGNHFISFMSLTSVLGIALGVAVLITVLSVMNGFDAQIKDRILRFMPQVTVSSMSGKIDNWQALEKHLHQMPQVTGVAPFVSSQAMITHEGESAFVLLRGVSPSQENQVLPISKHLIAGKLSALKQHHFGIVLGQGVANRLGASLGSKVTVYVPQTNLTPLGVLPRLKQFTVVGIFKIGYQFDYSYALLNWHDESLLLNQPNQISGIELKLKHPFDAPMVSDQLNQNLPIGLQAISWADQNANFFKALKMEKVMMFLILLLIIAVAAFNMLSSLVMIVTDKRADIAILRTLGAQTKTIMQTFMIQGMMVGLIGTLLGVILGVLLSLHVTQITDWLQALFHTQFLNSSVYYIDFLPSKLEASDVWHIVIVALLLSFIATLYPAYRAGKIQPAEALRYE